MLRKDQEEERQLDHRTDRGKRFNSCPYWPFQVTWLDNLRLQGWSQVENYQSRCEKALLIAF